MTELFYNALRITSLGIIILDENHKIVFFNNSIEKLCNIPEKKAVGKKIEDVLPVFSREQYINIIDTVLKTGQSRFCSSAIHKSFVYIEDEGRLSRRQNMKVEFLSSESKPYVLIQIIDITDNYKNELNLKNSLTQLKKGYDDLNFSKIVTERLAKYDALTGLLNRYYFEAKFNELAREVSEKGDKINILFVDLDGFKKVNDTYGHMVGDALLQLFASRIKNNLKTSDFAMRMGGDEFVIVLRQLAIPNYLEKSVNQLFDILRKPYYIDSKVIQISACIGISIYPDHSKNFSELLDKADKAMYCSKFSGKNLVTIYDEELMNQRGD